MAMRTPCARRSARALAWHAAAGIGSIAARIAG
jgi:hypothetical protein